MCSWQLPARGVRPLGDCQAGTLLSTCQHACPGLLLDSTNRNAVMWHCSLPAGPPLADVTRSGLTHMVCSQGMFKRRGFVLHNGGWVTACLHCTKGLSALYASCRRGKGAEQCTLHSAAACCTDPSKHYSQSHSWALRWHGLSAQSTLPAAMLPSCYALALPPAAAPVPLLLPKRCSP